MNVNDKIHNLISSNKRYTVNALAYFVYTEMRKQVLPLRLWPIRILIHNFVYKLL